MFFSVNSVVMFIILLPSRFTQDAVNGPEDQTDLHVVFQRGHINLVGEAMSLMLYRVNSKLVEKCASSHHVTSILHCLPQDNNYILTGPLSLIHRLLICQYQ